MPKSPDDTLKHFIVKHGLDAFEALPHFIWRTGIGPDAAPHRFNQIKSGDRWVGFAYTTSDLRERPLSLITGFYECVQTALYRKIPPEGLGAADGETKAWMIEGKPHGKQPRRPVGVPPICDLLGKSVWNNQAIIPVTADDFCRLRDYSLSHEFDTRKIPLFGREPENEQELLAAVVWGHKELGIRKIVRVRKAFPDLMVEMDGHPEPVHLELEVYSDGFFSHGHHEQVRDCRFTGDGKPVAVLCWIDNNQAVSHRVHRVFELRSLIREGKKVCW